MTHPELIVRVADDWLRGQFLGIATAARWRGRVVGSAEAAARAVVPQRPTVIALAVDPHDPQTVLQSVLDLMWHHPDVAVVLFPTEKITEERRPAWAAVALDCGARAILFPPLTRPVLEDLVQALMTAVIRRLGCPLPPDAPIDLATGDYEVPP